MVFGSFIVRNTCRPPLMEPAVSKCAPDSSTRASSRSACSSFWIGVYPRPTTPSTSGRPVTGFVRTVAKCSGTGSTSTPSADSIGVVCNGWVRTFQPPSFACRIASAAVNSAGNTVPNRCHACWRADTNDADRPPPQVSRS